MHPENKTLMECNCYSLEKQLKKIDFLLFRKELSDKISQFEGVP